MRLRTESDDAWAVPSAVFFLLGFAVAAVFALMPIEVKLGHFIIEDMFYYLRVAEHILAGEGSSFDAVAATNGYHPAWMLVAVLLARVFDGTVLVSAMLLVAALLHGVQAALVHRIAARHAGGWVALGITLIYVLNWRVIAINLGGLETPLAVAMVLVTIDWLDRKATGPLSGRDRVWLTVLLGLAILARMDLFLFAGVVLAFVWGRDVAVHKVALWRATGAGLASALGIGVVLSPWFAFSLTTSGVLLPNSRVALNLIRDPEAATSGMAAWAQQARHAINLLQDSANLFGVWPFLPGSGPMSLIATTLLFLAAAAILFGVWRSRRVAGAVVWICLGFAALHMAYYLVMSLPKVRYILPVAAAMTLPAAVALEALRQRLGRSGPVSALMGAVLAVSLAAGVQGWAAQIGAGRYHVFHPILRETALWLADELPQARVGAWNAGILSYFSRLPVTNLDGVINDEVLPYVRAGELAAYVEVRSLTHLVDIDSEIGRFLAWFDPDGWIQTEVVTRFADEAGHVVEVRRIVR